MVRQRDPKKIVTPYAFRVSPELLGLPLGGPWRRAGAILVDFVLIGLLLLVKEVSGALFGIACAYVLWRISSRTATGGVRGAFARPAVRVAAVVVFLASVGSIGSCFVSGPETPRFRAERGESGEVTMGRAPPGADGIGLSELTRGIGAAISLGSAETEEEARRIARDLATELERAGLDGDEIREVLGEMVREGPDRPWAAAVIDSAVAGMDTAAAPAPDGLEAIVAVYDSLLEAGDTAGARALRPRLAEASAGEEMTRLRRRADRLEDALRETRAEAEEEPGVLAFLEGLLDDLGLGLGWTGLYFTLFTAAWRGQTPGKRLFGLRVVRLNGEPLGWWPAFERFGGYAACLATGLLGFLQILWDANRQGLHDRVVGTVVVRTTGPGSRELARPRGPGTPGRGPGGAGVAAGVATVTRAGARPPATKPETRPRDTKRDPGPGPEGGGERPPRPRS